MRTFIYFVILMICAVLLGSCEHMKPKTEIVETETVEQDYHVPTVYDILDQRQELKYALWCDSVYLSIPEQILTHMLVTKGTTMSITEIVEDYWANRQFYHDTILKSMNIQKQYIPDSVPKQSIPHKQHTPPDTVNSL